MDLTTLARVRTLLKDTSTQNDTLIDQLIDAVSPQLERIMNRHALEVARTEQYDVAPGQRVFMLRGFPVLASPAAVVKNSLSRDFTAARAIDAPSYYLALARGVLTIDLVGLEPGPGTLQVAYTGGLATTTTNLVTAFPDISVACELQVAYLIQRKDELGLASFSAEGGSIAQAMPTKILDAARELLQPYRRMVATA